MWIVVCGGLVFVQVVEVEVEQPRRFVGILVVEWHEAVAEIERNGGSVCINRDVYVTASFSFRYNGASVRMKPFKSSSPQLNVVTNSCSTIL